MKLVIDISEQDYWLACNYPEALTSVYAQCIKKGKPLPPREKFCKYLDAYEEGLFIGWNACLDRIEMD